MAGLCGAQLGQMWYRGGRRWHRSGSGGSLEKLDLDDRFFLLPSQKAVTSDAMNIHPDLSDDDLSSDMGTETLLAHDLVPEGLPAHPIRRRDHIISVLL